MKQFNLHFCRAIFVSLWCFFSVLTLYAQDINIQGKVIDATTKTPLAGVSISIKNSSIGTSSDADGNFSLTAPKNARIVATFVGFQPLEINSQPSVTIQMTPVAGQLNEVVITATGIKKEAKKLGYAIQTIDASLLTKAREADPINSLKGNAVGLLSISIQRSGIHPT